MPLLARVSGASFTEVRGGRTIGAMARRGWPKAFLLAGLAAALLLVAAIGEELRGPATASGGPDEPPVVDCESRSQVVPGRGNRFAPRRTSMFAGPVAFSGAKRLRHQPRRYFRPSRPDRVVPVKVPIEVKARREVIVSLPPAEDEAVIEVGLDRAPYTVRGHSVELHPCPPDAEVAGRRVGRRTPFLGGFRIAGPGCLRVVVEVIGRSREITRRIAFGRRTCRAPG